VVLYVDSSALLKRYVAEHDSEVADSLLATDPVLATARITEVEVRRNLARLLDEPSAATAKRQFLADLDAFALVAVDATTCNEAARVAESTLCRSLDAIHIAAALRAGRRTTFLTFDVRQAAAARAAGLAVIGT
jgi:predicted nucleic acid-binding protein